MTAAARVLVAGTDVSAQEALATALAAAGYDVATAPHGAAALERIGSPGGPAPDLIVLDLLWPDADGLVLCAELSARAAVPIIICSETTHKRDRILGLKLGADDFLVKPVDPDELVARVEAVLRRARRPRAAEPAPDGAPGPSLPDQHRIREFALDDSRRRVTLGGRPVRLTPSEYQLLAVLMSRPDEVLSRQELAQLAWGYTHVNGSRSVDMYVSRLRAKLDSGALPSLAIVSVRRRGYKLVPEPGGV